MGVSGLPVSVIGGDQREVVLIQELLAQGAVVKYLGFPASMVTGAISAANLEEALSGVRVAIFPVSGTDPQGLIRCALPEMRLVLREEHVRRLSRGSLIIIGVVRPFLRAWSERYGLKLVETNELDELAILNAIPSAEGAVQLAMEELPVTIHGSEALVLGFGRLGTRLAQVLYALGSKVTIAARKRADLARARVQGYRPVEFVEMANCLGQVQVVFNTVPALVLDAGMLELLPAEALIIDLATNPGGTDFEAAKALGRKAILAPGLPGRVAPVTAGQILAENIPGIIQRELGF